MPKIEIHRKERGNFYYVIKANNGSAMITSRMFKRMGHLIDNLTNVIKAFKRKMVVYDHSDVDKEMDIRNEINRRTRGK